MSWWQAFWAAVRGFLSYLGTPLRKCAGALMVLVNLSPRQMQALCTLAMIGGIMANSFWIYLYVSGVRRAVDEGMRFDSPYFTIALDVVQWLAIMSGCFALFMSLIAFGAEWLRVKYRDVELGAGRGDGGVG